MGEEGQGTNPLYPTTKMWTKKQKNRGRQKRKEREKMGRKGRERKGKGEGDGEREGGRARLHILGPPRLTILATHPFGTITVAYNPMRNIRFM